MIVYSPSKINIGLHIERKRSDGFHDISTLMYPLPLMDIIEINVQFKKGFDYSYSGISIPGDIESNLCYKAWHLFNQNHETGGLRFHLHKQIPHGAGLGGGSSNAAKTLLALNELCGHPITAERLHEMASTLGSDCAFFLHNVPMYAEGRGEILTESRISLKGEYLVLANPGIQVNTAWAYSRITPNDHREELRALLEAPRDTWKDLIRNDFEESVINYHALIGHIKEQLYNSGAYYAAMSGSGSSVYGIFREKPVLPEDFHKYAIWEGFI